MRWIEYILVKRVYKDQIWYEAVNYEQSTYGKSDLPTTARQDNRSFPAHQADSKTNRVRTRGISVAGVPPAKEVAIIDVAQR